MFTLAVANYGSGGRTAITTKIVRVFVEFVGVSCCKLVDSHTQLLECCSANYHRFSRRRVVDDVLLKKIFARVLKNGVRTLAQTEHVQQMVANNTYRTVQSNITLIDHNTQILLGNKSLW